jgi:hypothetical protein
VNARREAEARADTASTALAAAEAREQNRVNRALNRTNRSLAAIDILILALLLFLGGLAAYDWLTGDLKKYLVWKIVAGAAGLLGLYHLIAHIRGKHILGTSNLLNWLGRRMLSMFLKQADVEGFDIDKEVEFVGGRAHRRMGTTSSEDFSLH